MKAGPNSSLKVALISSGLGYTLRGIETWMIELGRHLPLEVEVEVWSGGPVTEVERRVCRRLPALGRDLLPRRVFNWHRRYLIEQLSALPPTMLRLRAGKVNLAYCGDPALSWHLKRFQRWHRAKVVFMNGMALAAPWAAAFDGVHLLAEPYLEQARQELRAQDLSNFFVAPHFVDPSRFQPPTAAQRAAARAKLGLGQNDFVILNVGPVGTVSGKRLDFLVEEVGRLGTGFVLCSVGATEEGGEQVVELARQCAADRVKFLGRVERIGIPSVYQAADVFAIAALAEPFSIAILEAMSSGLPVVHHQNPVTSWITGEAGTVVDMTSPSSTASSMRRFKDQPDWKRTKGMKGRRLVEQRYTPERVCETLVTEFKRIVAS